MICKQTPADLIFQQWSIAVNESRWKSLQSEQKRYAYAIFIVKTVITSNPHSRDLATQGDSNAV